MVPDKLQNNYEKIYAIVLFECAVVCYKGDMCRLFLTPNNPNRTQDNEMNT